MENVEPQNWGRGPENKGVRVFGSPKIQRREMRETIREKYIVA